MSDYSLFKTKAPWIMAKLRADFPFLDVDDLSAVLGNLGHECNGFKSMQEIKPTVEGSRGGYGWPQWTGPRRRAYEAYCSRNNLDPKADASNYAYLFIELKGLEGSEGKSLERTHRAIGLKAKTIAFEEAFLRAGVKHYDSRIAYAEMAKEAYEASSFLHPTAEPSLRPSIDVPTTVVVEPIAKETNGDAVKTEGFDLSRYNKAIGTVLGGLLGIVATSFPSVGAYLTPEMQSAIIVMLGAIGTIIAPKNEK